MIAEVHMPYQVFGCLLELTADFVWNKFFAKISYVFASLSKVHL